VQRPASLPSGTAPRPIRRSAPGRFRALEHELRLPLDLRRAGGDVVWSPAQDPPHLPGAPFVQTLLDVTPLRWPRSDPVGRRMRRLLPRYRAAAAWVAISRYSADTCAREMQLPLARVEVAHLGVDPRFAPGPDRAGAPGRADGEPALLYVGEFGFHKGFGEAFGVVSALADAGHPHRLRMVGRLAPWWRPHVDELLAGAGHPERVDLLGHVPDVVEEYRAAAALVFTSRHEGFGLPLVEAMACGTPVVAFANSAVVEVVGDGGVLVPDGDVAAMVDALVPLLTDAAAWEDASSRALERSKAFDWRVTADVHADVLRAVSR
jgi:glycosyltransferase involved in cell wall biosynthesis